MAPAMEAAGHLDQLRLEAEPTTARSGDTSTKREPCAAIMRARTAPIELGGPVSADRRSSPRHVTTPQCPPSSIEADSASLS